MSNNSILNTSANSDTQNHISGPTNVSLTIQEGQSVEIIGTNVYNSLMDKQSKMQVGLIALACLCGLLLVILIFILVKK
jgi:hypothetical protein